MIIMFVVWLTVALLVFLCVFLGKRDHEDSAVAFGVIGTIFGAMAFLTTILTPLSNAGRIQEMVAFYDSNVSAYSTTFDNGKALLSEQQFIQGVAVPIEGSIEKQQLATTVASYLKDWRDQVVQYNNNLQKMRYFRNNPWTSWYIPRVPDELQFLVIN